MDDCCGYCDACEALSFQLEREAREEERQAREERLAYRAQHPLVWL